MNSLAPLGGIESLTALQATSLVLWRDEAAKRTHPLRSYLPGLRCQCRQQLPEQVAEECQPSAEATPERAKNGFHRFPAFSRCSATVFAGISGRSHWIKARIPKLRPIHDDRLRQRILCRIAHISPGASAASSETCEALLANVMDNGEAKRQIGLAHYAFMVRTCFEALFHGPA